MLPAGVSSVRVADSGLAETLRAAGAMLVDAGADAELGPLNTLRGGAPWAAVPLGALRPEARFRLGRLLTRVVRSLRLRSQAATTLRGLRKLGYRETRLLYWEPDQQARFADGVSPGGLRGRLPLRAVATAFRESEASLVEAAAAASGAGRPQRLRAKGGGALAFGDTWLLRVAVGPAREKLAAQSAALDALRALGPPREVARRVPWQTGAGRTGLGDWTLEPLLDGASPAPQPSPELLAECIDFLVLLNGIQGGEDRSRSLAQHSQAIAAVAPARHASAVRELGERLDEALSLLPRGFAHGDFGLPNLLVADGRLAGVVDWEAAGPSRLPVLDLFHLLVELELRPREQLGPAMVRVLLPLAAEGGGPHVQQYATGLGLPLDRPLLESLALAYWLEIVGYALATYSRDERRQRTWVRENVERVVPQLDEAGFI